MREGIPAIRGISVAKLPLLAGCSGCSTEPVACVLVWSVQRRLVFVLCVGAHSLRVFAWALVLFLVHFYIHFIC